MGARSLEGPGENLLTARRSGVAERATCSGALSDSAGCGCVSTWMAERAAHLVDHVFPDVQVRQWSAEPLPTPLTALEEP